MTELRLVVVTGLSGSGKSTAIKVLEDLGFYCIDNLPVALIPRFVEVWESSSEEVRRVALGLDVRERHFLDEFPRIFEELRARGVALEVLYLEASDDVLVRRFSETRRPHPAAGGGILADGIRREREKLRPLREVASRILDTSALTVHELRSALRDLVERPEAGTMTIALVSFGYKYGLPTDADLALDCRFLPNPPTGCCAARRARSSSAACSTSSPSPCRSTSARGRAISPSRSAARAAATARSCWSRS